MIKNLASAWILVYLTQFLYLVKENMYPLKNIALLLWLETVRWYQSVACQSMWYFEETKRFWRAGYQLLKSRKIPLLHVWAKMLGEITCQQSKFR